MLVFDVTDQVRETIHNTFVDLLRERDGVFSSMARRKGLKGRPPVALLKQASGYPWSTVPATSPIRPPVVVSLRPAGELHSSPRRWTSSSWGDHLLVGSVSVTLFGDAP